MQFKAVQAGKILGCGLVGHARLTSLTGSTRPVQKRSGFKDDRDGRVLLYKESTLLLLVVYSCLLSAIHHFPESRFIYLI